jgi:hypothetical protein
MTTTVVEWEMGATYLKRALRTSWSTVDWSPLGRETVDWICKVN